MQEQNHFPPLAQIHDPVGINRSGCTPAVELF
jgi:hypothetical protein